MLKYLGSSLLDLVREIDTACRIGGDEFGVILPDCNSENAKLVCQRLINKFHEQYPEYNLSIGLTQTKADTVPTHDEFIKLADERMYLAKKQSGSYICADDKSKHDT